VAWLTLNRPGKRNALNRQLLEALDDALVRCAGDTSVRCVVIAAAGDRAFSAGADLREALTLTPPAAREWIVLGHRALNRIVDLPQPAVAGPRFEEAVAAFFNRGG
jgi:enoyl-CoA hydratase